MLPTLPLKKRPYKVVNFGSIDELAASSVKKVKEDCPVMDGPSSSESSLATLAFIANQIRQHQPIVLPGRPNTYQYLPAFHSYQAMQPVLHRSVPFALQPRRHVLPEKRFVAAPSPATSSDDDQSSTDGGSYSCEDCPKVFKRADRYRAHLRRHSSKSSGKYRCHQCGKDFVQRSSLRTHERIHTGERPYACPSCPEAFGDYSTFTKHQRTHTGEKPYSCRVCGRQFSQSGNMHRHLKAVHGGSDHPVRNLRPNSTGSSSSHSSSSFSI